MLFFIFRVLCMTVEIDKVYNCDCLDLMQAMKEQGLKADWCITDPPYGIGIDHQKKSVCNNPKHNRKEHSGNNWDNNIPSKEVFDLLFDRSKNQVIFGANYFNKYLPQGNKGWVVWDKGQRGLTMSDCELIYVSSDSPTRIITYNRVELLKDGTIHPTQKPLAVLCKLLTMYTKEGDLILDPFAGSQSLRIACHKMQRHYIGAELDKEYYEKGCAWFNQVASQISIFDMVV